MSHRQLRWQELLSQFDITIVYIRGEDNTVVDVLSRMPVNGYPDETVLTTHEVWGANVTATVLQLQVDGTVMKEIIARYEEDEFAIRTLATNMPGIGKVNGLLYVGSQLIIPHVRDIQEHLFQLVHDCLEHFSMDKSYTALCDACYWPNMRKDLEKSYTVEAPRPEWPRRVLY